MDCPSCGEPSAERLMQAPAIQAVRDMLDYYADEINAHVWQEIASLVDDIPDCESATALPHDEHSEPSATWTHCSPALLARGLSCASTVRRTCACEPVNGGHDHLPSEPQGEPSDAQVTAEALRKWPHDPNDATVSSARAVRRLSFLQGALWMRAALRAAGGSQGRPPAAEAERARIVADLREWSRPLGNSPEEDALRLVIDRIERG